MKLIQLSIFTLFLASCGSTENTSSTATPEENTATTEVTTPEKSHAIVGDWRADAADAGMEITVSFDDAGTFSQEMGGQSQTGTWEAIDENQIKIDTENLENGQVWQLSEVSSDGIKLAFDLGDGFSPAVLFKAL